MNIRDFINECEKIAAKYGDECEIKGWGDEGGAIGIEAMKKVGTCKTSEWKKDGETWNQKLGERWSKTCEKFHANTSRETDDGTTNWFADINEDEACISL